MDISTMQPKSSKSAVET